MEAPPFEECGPCEDEACQGPHRPNPNTKGCSCYEEACLHDALARGGGAGARLGLLRAESPTAEEEEIRDALARSEAHRSEVNGTALAERLAAATRVSIETWHGLGRLREDKAFNHDCKRMCLHGLARWDPEIFRELAARLRRARTAQDSSARAHAAAPTRGKSKYDSVDMLGVRPSALLAAELAEREKEAAETEATLEETRTSVFDELIGQDVCIAGALAFVGRERSWLYRQRTSRSVQDADANATGATSGEALTAGSSVGSSRAPGVDAKRALEHLRPPAEVVCTPC